MSNNDKNNADNRYTSIPQEDAGYSTDHMRNLDDFDEAINYEESDRDTDYASIYTEDIIDEDEIDELLSTAGSEQEEEFPLNTKQAGSASMIRKSSDFNQTDPDEWEAEDGDMDTGSSWTGTDPREEFADDFDDDPEPWEDEDDYETPSRATWPLGLVAVAVIALLLLGAGGYGVVQQRSAMEAEIRELQAALATAASPEDVAASRGEVTNMRAQYEELRITLNSLNLENRGLRDTVAGLESQLAAQQEMATVVSKPAAPKAAIVAKPVPPKTPAPKPVVATPQPAKTQAATGGWFVNFGSYNKRATADSWSTRLQPPAGKVIVATGDKGGTTFFRVRVVNLSSKDEAERVARELEKSYGLSRLWVGKQ